MYSKVGSREQREGIKLGNWYVETCAWQFCNIEEDNGGPRFAASEKTLNTADTRVRGVAFFVPCLPAHE